MVQKYSNFPRSGGFCLVVEFHLEGSGTDEGTAFSLFLYCSFIEFGSAICQASICCPNSRSAQLNLNYLQTLMDYWLARRIQFQLHFLDIGLEGQHDVT